MTDKTELLANIETSTRERDQISRSDILLKRLVLSLFVAVVVLVYTNHSTFIHDHSGKEKIKKKLDARN